MSHKRTDIRNALVSLLKGTSPTFNTLAGAMVFPNRVHNLNVSQLPAIIVYDEQETAITRNLGGRDYIRTLMAKIDIIVEATTNYDTTIDNIAKQVEDIISANPKLSGTASGVKYTATELHFDPADKTIGRATLTYEIQYLT